LVYFILTTIDHLLCFHLMNFIGRLQGAHAMVEPLRDFIAERRRVSTADIVAHFREHIPAEDLPLFRHLLRQVAVLKKDEQGTRAWELRSEFSDEQ